MTKCEWCDNEADDWGYNGVELCDSCRNKQLEYIEQEEINELEREMEQ